MRGSLAALALAASLGCGSGSPTAPTGAIEVLLRAGPASEFEAAWQAWIRDRYFS